MALRDSATGDRSKPVVINPFAVFAEASRRWWYDWTVVLSISPLWVLAQLLIITGPPATAVVYALMHGTYESQYWGPRELWSEFKRLFRPAWRWGLINLVVVGIGLFNLAIYWPNSGSFWIGLRLFWIGILSIGFSLNLFYWPFWLAQEDQSMRNTYANAGRFLLLNPLPALILSAVSFTVLAISLLTALPFMLGSLAWVALVGVIAVHRALEINIVKPK